MSSICVDERVSGTIKQVESNRLLTLRLRATEFVLVDTSLLMTDVTHALI